jgi:hypothetical protein
MEIYLLKVKTTYRHCDDEECGAYPEHHSVETIFQGVFSSKEKAEAEAEKIIKQYDKTSHLGRRKPPPDFDKRFGIYSYIRSYEVDQGYEAD